MTLIFQGSCVHGSRACNQTYAEAAATGAAAGKEEAAVAGFEEAVVEAAVKPLLTAEQLLKEKKRIRERDKVRVYV